MEENKHRNTYFRDDDIVLTEWSVIPIVNKERRVVEEIKVRKSVAIHSETFHTSLKSTEVNVEKFKET